MRSSTQDPWEYNLFGIITGSTVAQLPDIPCQMLRFKAKSTNIGSFFIGHNASTCYWELDAGNETEFFEVDNLNNFWCVNGSGTVDYLAYWIQR